MVSLISVSFLADYSDSYYGQDAYGLNGANTGTVSSSHSRLGLIIISVFLILASGAIIYRLVKRRHNKRYQAATDTIVSPEGR